MKNQNNYLINWFAFCLVTIGDFFAIMGIRGEWDYWRWWVWGDLGLLIILFLIGWMKELIRPKASIVVRLLSNASGSRTINILYVIVFTLNMAALGNALLPLFQKDVEINDALYPLGVCLVAMIALILFFPIGRNKKDDNATYVFVSGISYIPSFDRKKSYDSFGLNLVPLVRMLQICEEELTAGTRKCRFHIIQTRAFTNDSAQTLTDVMHVVNSKKENEISETPSINDKLRLLIREVAIKEFPNLETQIRQMEITFSEEPIDYNEDSDFAYQRINEEVELLDDAKHQLYFNLTPGTGVISSLMMLLAIDGDRKLYYYSQQRPNFDSEKERQVRYLEDFKRSLLHPVRKERIPLSNILSQALESELSRDEESVKKKIG